MSKYILKSDIPPCPNIDLSEYVKKSDIPSCPKIDLSEYIKKTDIPPRKQRKCPKCPMNLLCPSCDKKVKITIKKNLIGTTY